MHSGVVAQWHSGNWPKTGHKLAKTGQKLVKSWPKLQKLAKLENNWPKLSKTDQKLTKNWPKLAKKLAKTGQFFWPVFGTETLCHSATVA